MRWSFLKTVRLVMLVAAPFYCGLAVTASPMVETVFGTKWLGMVPYIQIIALALMLMTVQILFAPLTNALGKPSVSMFSALSGAIMFPVAFLVGAEWGLIGMAWAWLIAAPLLLLVTALLSTPLIGVTLWDVGRAMLPGLAPALVMAVGVGLAAQAMVPIGLAAPGQLVALVALGVMLYGGLLWLLEREAIAEVLRLVRRRQPPAVDAATQDAI